MEYSCPATGEFPIITWFYNDVLLQDGDAGVSIPSLDRLIISDPQVQNSGIYQCSVGSLFDFVEETRSWILEVRETSESKNIYGACRGFPLLLSDATSKCGHVWDQLKAS